MASAEDISVFFDTDEFAVNATLDHVEVRVIFDNGFTQGSVGLSGMSSSQPSMTLASAQVPANPVGLGASVNGSEYLVAAHEPDGTGLSRLILETA